MPLFFTAADIGNLDCAITFDDVTLAPCHSAVSSRKSPDTASRFTRQHRVRIPIIPANMLDIAGERMVLAMHQLGAVGILHRGTTVDQRIATITSLVKSGVTPASATIGVKEGVDVAAALIVAGAQVIAIDIAHGDHEMMLDLITAIKRRWDVAVIAGNVCMPQAAVALAQAGADAIKVGIGPGSRCKTRLVAGVGFGQLTAIALCSQALRAFDVPIIADGGIRHLADIGKALAAGADTVMFGRLFAGTDEANGPIESMDGVRKMRYGGMASDEVRRSWVENHHDGDSAEEGEVTWVDLIGPVNAHLRSMHQAVQLSMSYLGAMNLSEFRAHALFVRNTPAAIHESAPHSAEV